MLFFLQAHLVSTAARKESLADPILEMSKMRIKEAKPFVPDPTAREQGGELDLNPGALHHMVRCGPMR